MTEQNAWADLNRLLTEYTDAYYGQKNENDWPSGIFQQLKAAFELYYNNKIINISSTDATKLKICLYGIGEHPNNKMVQDGALKDMKSIFQRLSGNQKVVKEYVTQEVVDKIFGGR